MFLRSSGIVIINKNNKNLIPEKYCFLLLISLSIASKIDIFR